MMNLTHNKAVLLRLLKSANEWVTLPELHQFTQMNCVGSCMAIHSRINDLRTKYGYTSIENRQLQNGSTKLSSYKLVISPSEIHKLRKLWVIDRSTIPHYNQAKVKPAKQADMFAGVLR